MIYSRGAPAHYAGSWDARRTYDGGAVVYNDQDWFVSKIDNNDDKPTRYNASWAHLGGVGAVPTQVAHKWHPRVLQYPTTDDPMDTEALSDPVDVCSDCWKDADLKNAFDPRVHLYVIHEPEAALGL